MYAGTCRSWCPQLDCALVCPAGYALDETGCATCACARDEGCMPEERVCGANGATYESACDAESAAVGVVLADECPSLGCLTSSSCPAGSTCVVPESGCLVDPLGGEECLGLCMRSQRCGAVDDLPCPAGYVCGNGACVSACQCSAVYEPVCGSDGLVYDNACAAACVGVAIAKPGFCCEPLPACALSCEAGLELDGNECPLCACRAAEQCPCSEVSNPVCALRADGSVQRFENACQAQCRGASVWFPGECP